MYTTMESAPNITLTCKAGIGCITLSRPKANAYDRSFLRQFHDYVLRANADENIRVVVIRSKLPRFFCGGADIDAFSEASVAERRALAEDARALVAEIADGPKLYLAAIAGHALGGGLELAMGCDLRLAVEGSYQLGLPEVKLGVMPGNGGCVRLPRLVGSGRAIELLATGRSVMPDEALRIGLVDRVFPADVFEASVHGIAVSLARAPRDAVGMIKRCVSRSASLDVSEALHMEADLSAPLFGSSNAEEGLSAFRDRRDPVFQ